MENFKMQLVYKDASGKEIKKDFDLNALKRAGKFVRTKEGKEFLKEQAIKAGLRKQE